MNYQDKLTLDEIAHNDVEMVKDAIKNADRYAFHSKESAYMFQGRAVQSTVKRCGVDVKPGMSGEKADMLLKKQKVKIESRRYNGADQWKTGTYIYKNDELVSFVSNVFQGFQERNKAGIYTGVSNPYSVITNARIH